jgi:hypothetical protein
MRSPRQIKYTFAMPSLTARAYSTACELLASAAKAVEVRSCCGMAEAMPFPKHRDGPLLRGLRCGPTHGSLDGLRKTHGYEIILRVQVVLAGLVDDANLMEPGRGFVRDDLINLAQLQRRRVALVPDADDELSFTFHGGRGRVLIM